MTTVVNLRRGSFDVYIGRSKHGIFGNPFVIGKDGDRAAVIEKFRQYFESRIVLDARFHDQVHKQLEGKVLGCFCKPLACHGDVYVEHFQKCGGTERY